MRAVLDPNVLIAALLSREGPPAQIVSRWLAGDFELVVSPWLLSELERALAYPRVREHVSSDEAAEFVALLAQMAVLGSDRPAGAPRSADPDDDYLVALAEAQKAVLVSGDRHLLDLAGRFPIEAPRAFLETISRER